MDKFRWSNGYSRAIEFEAQQNNFLNHAIMALREFHRGGNQPAQLHINVYGSWMPVGKNDNVMTVYLFCENDRVDLDVAYQKLETELFFKQSEMWQLVEMAYRNRGRLQMFLNNVSDILTEVINNDE